MNKLVFFICLLLSVNLVASDNFPDVEGWNKSDKINTYDSETLWEYINGAAEYYLAYNFHKLEWVEYSISDDIYIKAEIYYHSSPINAFGIYAYERSDDSDFLEIGAEAYMAHSALNFYTGKCYIKIYSHNNSDNTLKTIKSIAVKISEEIDKTASTPAELEALPTQNKVPYSEKYKPENYLGYSFFKNVVMARYKIDDKEVEFFSIQHNTDEDALANLQQYFSFLKSDLTPEVNQIFELDDLFNDTIYVLVNNNRLIGVTGANSLAAAKKLLGEPNSQ